MTKLLEWLSGAAIFFTIWFSIITRQIKHSVLDDYREFILYSPIIFVFIFGLYSATVVLWRVYTFNDCKNAAKELKTQIKEAKADLTKKGFQF